MIFFKLCKERAILLQRKRILRIIEQTNKIDPFRDANFKKITPKIHLVPEALNEVNTFANLGICYSQNLVAYYKDDIFPFDIEATIIKLERPYLIYNLTDAGHIWSDAAADMMYQMHPVLYYQNVLPQKSQT